MTSLADDLLRNRPISDLRVLIKQLHDDGEEKKRELRRMVGSQYHEFIQSADNLAGMHVQSQQMLSVLDKFWKQRDSFVKEVHGFLDGNTDANNKLGKTTDNSRLVRTEELVTFADSSSLWRDLGRCDVYSATLRVIAALAVGKDSKLIHESYIHPMTLEALEEMKLTASQQSNLRSVSFLSETVLDDASLLAQNHDRLSSAETSVSLLTTAKTYAVIITLQAVINGSSQDTNFDPLTMFLQHAATYLGLILENDLSANRGGIEGGMLHLVEVLQSIVLEGYTLFVHPFPHPFPAQGTDNRPTTAQGLIGVLVLQLQGDVNQLFASEHLLGASINSPDTSALAKLKKWLKEQLRIVTDRCSTTLAALGNAAQIAQLQQSTYLACVHPHFLAVATAEDKQRVVHGISLSTLWCDASLALMLPTQGNKGKRASQDVTELSLLLWTRVFRVSFLHQVERLLQKACEDIFANVQQQVTVAFRLLGLKVDYELNKKGGLSIIINATEDILSITSLTSSQLFMIAERIRYYLDGQLAQLRDDVVVPVQRGEEIMIDGRRRTNSGGHLNSGAAAAAAGLSGQALKEALQGNCSKLLGQVLSLLRRMLEAFQDVLYGHRAYPLPPDTTSEMLNSDGNEVTDEVEKRLWVAIQKNFLQSQQVKNSKITLTRPDELLTSSAAAVQVSTNRDERKGKAKPAMESALQGVLFIGRLAWVLRGRADTSFSALRDDFTTLTSSSLAAPSTDEAISTTAAGSGSTLSRLDSFSTGGAATTRTSGRVSEEQCRSAFEISDTNGDGVVDHAEALDALRALCHHEREEEILSAFTLFTSEKHIPSLQRSLSALHTLTFEEFILIAGPLLLMGAQDQRSLSRLFSALDHLIVASHLSYITAITCQGGVILTKALVDDLGGFGKEMVKCRALWIARDIDSAASEDKEKLWLPGRCSVALQQFFFQFNAQLSAAILSLDTLQALPVDTSSPSQLKNEDALYLDHFMKSRRVEDGADNSALAMLCHRWSSSIIIPFLKRVYTNTITALSTAQPVGVTINKRVFQQRLDDAHMQLLLDLMVLDDLFTVPDVKSKGTTTAGRRFAMMKDGPFQELIDKCRLMLDPIMLELSDIVLLEAVKRIKEETKLILGPVSTVGAATANGGGVDSNTVGAASVSVDHGLLERLFNTAFEHNAVPKAVAAPRLALLPLALPGTAGNRHKGAESEAPTVVAGAGKGSKPVTGTAGTKNKGPSTAASAAITTSTKWW